jgi:hypothetical protein
MTNQTLPAILCQTLLRLAVLRAPDATSLCQTKPALPIPALPRRALTDPIVTRRARTCVAMPALLQPDVPGQTTLEYAPPNHDCLAVTYLAAPNTSALNRALSRQAKPRLPCSALLHKDRQSLDMPQLALPGPSRSDPPNLATPYSTKLCHAKGPFNDGRVLVCQLCWAMPDFAIIGLARKSLALTALLHLAMPCFTLWTMRRPSRPRCASPAEPRCDQPRRDQHNLALPSSADPDHAPTGSAVPALRCRALPGLT